MQSKKKNIAFFEEGLIKKHCLEFGADIELELGTLIIILTFGNRGKIDAGIRISPPSKN